MTEQPQPRPPLWRVMVEAEHRTPLISGNTGGGQSWLRRKIAAEIRAVADDVVPKCDCPDGGIASRAMWLARARVRDRLLDEADHAEAGE